MLKKFCIPYMTDERMAYVEKYLIALGYESTYDVDSADFVILPIPAKAYMFENISSKNIFYGAGNFNGINYNDDEAFLLENAYLTSEGAVALLKQESDKAIYNSKILIAGYGRIARALHKALAAMGAKITVFCRSDEDKLSANFNGARVIDYSQLNICNDFDFVFNTIPHLIFAKEQIDALKSDTLIFDLASFPGGVDTLYSKSKGIRLVDSKALPSRFSKKSAGELIAKSIDKKIKGDLL